MNRSTIVPLYDKPFYSYNINLAGTSYHLKFVYNEQTESYFMSIYTYDKIPISLGINLVPRLPIAYWLSDQNWTGFFYLSPIADIEKDYNRIKPRKIHEYYELIYYYDDQQEQNL